MDKIKYLIITTVESNMKSFCLPLAKELKKKNFDVSIMCNMSDKFLNENKEKFNCIPIGIKRGLHPFNLIKTIFKMRKIFKQNKFDIIQYGTENAAMCGSIAGYLAKIPIRIYEHWGCRFVGYKGFMRFVSKKIEKIAARYSTEVRQVSYKNMQLCLDNKIYKADKVKVLGFGGTIGVDFSIFDISRKKQYCEEIRIKYGIDDNKIVFGFVGRIQTDKGVNELITAFKKLIQKYSDINLLMVGAIDDANKISDENMNWINESPYVIMTGFVSDVYKYMSAFDIMVHPTYREGFGMVLQEAAAIKVPIITTDIIGPGEFIKNEETGILVEVKNSDQLYNAMEKLINNENLRKQYSENCYEHTKKYFERAIMINRIIEDREELLKKHKIVI